MTRRRRRERGQVLPLVALGLVVITGFTGLTVDLGHQFVVKRQLQAAADAAALAAATTLGNGAPTQLYTTPTAYNNAAVIAAHDYAASDGFATTIPASAGGSSANYYSPACYSGGGVSNFREMFFDSSYGTSCASGFPPSGFNTAVQVNIPPQVLPGAPPIPSQCQAGSGSPDNCVQVVITYRVTNYIMGVFGQANEYLQAVATAYANPFGQGGAPLPQGYSAYLYEPATGCTGQCYTPTVAPSKGALSCTNCPTMWAQNIGGQLNINSENGATLPTPTHLPAVVSAGHIVNQENNLIFCDTYGGVTCGNNSAPAGSTGYSLGPSANLYCGGVNAGNAVCTNTTPPGNLQKVTGNSTTYSAQAYPMPTPATPVNNCGGLILNGDPITSANNPPVFFDASGHALSSVNSKCVPSPTEPYTIEPGQYQYIVINHGQYEFEGGLFYIYGTAPVDTATVSSTVEANGIDHSQEQTGVQKDWDLCQAPVNNNPAASCPTLTAGVWIGHGMGCGGNNKCGAQVNSTGVTCNNGQVTGGTTGGGGDKTDITGSGVSFYFTAASAGLVSTAEVDSIVLTGPNVGALATVGNRPVLINMQNPTAWSHLDGNSGQNTQFSGMIYQTPSATGGGLDIDPGAGNHMSRPFTLLGQVLVYSLDFFGSGNNGNGGAIDFTYGYGSASTTPTGAGNNETSLVTIPSNALTSAGAGLEKLTVSYTDEWMLDAYDMSVQINSLATNYFSRPLWSIAPNGYVQGSYSGVLPPQNGYTPSDANPRYMASGQGSPYYVPPAPYVAGTGTHEYTLHTDQGQTDDTVWDVSGDWSWGNQSNIAGANSQNYAASIAYTFPVPSGSTVNIQLHVVDGDHCGDYDNVSTTLANVSTPGASLPGGVVLVQ